MAKNRFIKLGLAASLAVAATPLVAVYADQTATTHVRIGVATSVSCSSAGNYNTSDVNLGDSVAPGTTTPTVSFIVTGATNSLNGFTITGEPTSLVHSLGSESAGPKIIYKSGTDTPTVSNWWVTTQEDDGVAIGDTIVLTSQASQYDFRMGAAATVTETQYAGVYTGQIEWTCAVQQ
jgi:hypothetical protein